MQIALREITLNTIARIDDQKMPGMSIWEKGGIM